MGTSTSTASAQVWLIAAASSATTARDAFHHSSTHVHPTSTSPALTLYGTTSTVPLSIGEYAPTPAKLESCSGFQSDTGVSCYARGG